MSHAGYMRGSAAISDQITRERRPVEFEIMDNLNALKKYEDCGRPFGPVSIIHDPRKFWSIEDSKGVGYWYKNIHELMRRWDVSIVGYDSNIGAFSAVPNVKVRP